MLQQRYAQRLSSPMLNIKLPLISIIARRSFQWVIKSWFFSARSVFLLGSIANSNPRNMVHTRLCKRSTIMHMSLGCQILLGSRRPLMWLTFLHFFPMTNLCILKRTRGQVLLWWERMMRSKWRKLTWLNEIERKERGRIKADQKLPALHRRSNQSRLKAASFDLYAAGSPL